MDNDKKLSKMRYWLIGVFAISVGAITAILSLIPESSIGVIISNSSYLTMIGIIAAVVVAFYFIYNWFLGRQ